MMITETGTMHQRLSIRLASGGFFAMAAAIGIGRFVYTPILPAMIDSLGWSKSDAGLVGSANFLGYLIGAIAASKPIAPGRQRVWLLTALAVSALTTAGMAAPLNFAGFIDLRLAGGVASAFVIVLASTLVLSRLSQAGRGSFAALHFAGVGVGIAISAWAVTAMQEAGADWRALWIAAGAIALLATALAGILIPAQSPGLPSASAAAERVNRGALPLIVAYGLFGFGYVITATFLVTIVRMTPEIRAAESSIWIIFGLAAVPSVALWSWIGSRTGLMTALVIACLAEAASVAASVEWVTPIGVYLSALLLGGLSWASPLLGSWLRSGFPAAVRSGLSD
jgi:predicted MFS family arabinose efflux permease